MLSPCACLPFPPAGSHPRRPGGLFPSRRRPWHGLAAFFLVATTLLAPPPVAAGQPCGTAIAATGVDAFPPCIEVEFEAHGVTGLPPVTITWLSDTGRQYFGNPVLLRTLDYPDGFHSLTATATNPHGSASFTSFFTVDDLAVSPASATPNPTPGLTITATGSLEGAVEWSWSWGDGTATPWSCDVSDPTFAASHTYVEPGSYLVRLRGRNCRDGTRASPPLEVVVGDPDAIEIVEFQAQGCVAGFCVFDVGEPVVFAQKLTAVPTELRYDWNGDGEVDQVAASPVPTHAYGATGAFRPRLTAIRGAQQDTRTHEQWILITGTAPSTVFDDGFETGDLSCWSDVQGGPTGPPHPDCRSLAVPPP